MTTRRFEGSAEEVLQQMGNWIGELETSVALLSARAAASEIALHSVLVGILLYNEGIDEGHWSRVLSGAARIARTEANNDAQGLALADFLQGYADWDHKGDPSAGALRVVPSTST